MSTAEPRGTPETSTVSSEKGPGKVPDAFGQSARKSRGPWPEGAAFRGNIRRTAMRSDIMKKGLERTPHRGLMRATGLADELSLIHI